MNALDEITESFSRLPGIGKKSAARIANHLLRADSVFMARFANQIATLQEKIKACSVCGSWTEDDPCPICSAVNRDRTLICVVEQPQDVVTILLAVILNMLTVLHLPEVSGAEHLSRISFS